MPTASVDALITDPPYSSGGMTRSDRTQAPDNKYCQNGETLGRATFTGDNRDGRAWHYWMSLVLSECQRIVKPGGYVLTFTDWRMLPTITDAIQSGGFVWRGIIAWDKGRGARAPHTGYFKHQCEYIAWGSNGTLAKSTHGGPFDGCIRETVKQSDKHHMTGKPTDLMRQLVQCVPPGGVVLDPFMGSGTTGVACMMEGREFIGIEKEPAYHAIAERRIQQAAERLL